MTCRDSASRFATGSLCFWRASQMDFKKRPDVRTCSTLLWYCNLLILCYDTVSTSSIMSFLAGYKSFSVLVMDMNINMHVYGINPCVASVCVCGGGNLPRDPVFSPLQKKCLEFFGTLPIQTTRKASCRWQTHVTLAKRLHGLCKSSGVVNLCIDSLLMVSY